MDAPSHLSYLGIVVAALGGAAVGVERQRTGHATGMRARFGGVRTFTLLGGIGGLAGWLATRQSAGFALVLAASALALIVAAYVAASREEIDATTEVAALVVVGAGVTAGLGWLALASAIIAVSTLLLVEKSHLHALVARIADDELRAAARFGVMAIVVLPLLPEGPYGPLGGVKPRELWLLVLFFSALSFAGYAARRIFGPGRGYPMTGLLAGLVSSTNATFMFARQSRQDAGMSRPLALGTIAACTMLFPRVLVATLVLNADVARPLLPYLIPPFAVGLAGLAILWRSGSQAPRQADLANPLQFATALQMAITFQAVLFIVNLVRRFAGTGGLLATGALLGLHDVDALTISMSRNVSAAVPAALAAQAIAVGVMANCVTKAVIALALGARPFRRVAGVAIAVMAVAIAIALTAAMKLPSLRG
jgi:uncharacterized membrane protein (DUF4010 family)